MIMFYPGRVEESSQHGCCLMDRVSLSRVGTGGGAHTGIQKEPRGEMEEERIPEDRRAFCHANVRVRGLNRGQLLSREELTQQC